MDLIIINKSGGVIYSKNLSNQGSTLSDNDYLRLGSTFHSLHAIATQVAPIVSAGIEMIDTDTLKLYSFASKTGSILSNSCLQQSIPRK
jgi:trafficking protein particle complex subunit 4